MIKEIVFNRDLGKAVNWYKQNNWTEALFIANVLPRWKQRGGETSMMLMRIGRHHPAQNSRNEEKRNEKNENEQRKDPCKILLFYTHLTS